MAKKQMSIFLTIALVISFLTLSTAAASETKVGLTAAQSGDQLVVTLNLKDVIFNGLSIALQYDVNKLTPVRPATGEAAQRIGQAVTPLAPIFKEDWETGITGWFSPISQGMKLDTGKGFLEYTFIVQPNGEGVDPDKKCLVVPSAGLDILQFHFKVTAGADLRYSDLALLPDYYPENKTGIAIADEGTGVSAPEVVTIDMSGVAKPDEGKPTPTPTTTPSTPPIATPPPASGQPGGGTTTKVPDKTDGGQPPPAVITFPDTKGHWAETSIGRLTGLGIITGYPNGRFGPEDHVSRAQMAVMLARAYALEPTGDTANFTDIKGHWAAPSIREVVAAGYLQGSAAGFRPDEDMSREELAVVVARILKLESNESSNFTDHAKCAAWSAGAVAAMEREHLITGYPDGSFGPQDPVSRSQAATLLDRILT